MKTELSLAQPADVQTECLVAVVLDHGEKDKPDARVATAPALQQAAAEVIASGEATGKLFETVLVHRPQGLAAKRLLLVGGGKAKSFSAYDLRRVAGTAARFLKSRSLRSFAMVAPEPWNGGAPAAVKAVVEGVFVGDFDPDTYKSDRKDQSLEALTVVAAGDPAALRRALEEGRIVGESQNFTRELVNEPGNRMTPTALARRAADMVRLIAEHADGFRMTVEAYGADKIKELKMGAFWSVAQGSDEPPALIVIKY
ncbi:MAG TPA: M17 family peptidase N-terminal domain-containing protein, partial [Terriglobales bacterium]|nr:M17 family peptidase N-terminal domain-containing protein [Terriglobales bacterium]